MPRYCHLVALLTYVSSVQMNAAAESCPFKIALSGGAGFALGGAFGFLTGAVRPGSPSPFCSPMLILENK